MDKEKLRFFRADLHIHSCLSPCGDWDMSPALIIRKAIENKLDIIAVTDHNSIENAETTMDIGRKKGITVFPAMEICSVEEVHILALYDNIDGAKEMQTFVYNNLDGENNPDVFGYQVVANENDEVVSQNQRLLIGATKLSLHSIVDKVIETGGISIAAHIDRRAYSILSQLGFIPPDLKLDAVEVSFRDKPEEASGKYMLGDRLPCITSSDAHFPEEIGRVSTKFYMAAATINEMVKALGTEEGRYIKYSVKN